MFTAAHPRVLHADIPSGLAEIFSNSRTRHHQQSPVPAQSDCPKHSEWAWGDLEATLMGWVVMIGTATGDSWGKLLSDAWLYFEAIACRDPESSHLPH